MQYEISNPSDPYTFVAESHEVAALVIFILGPAYGAKPEDDEAESVPIFLFGGATEWYTEQFSRTPQEGLDALEDDVATALESVMLGHFSDRRRYSAALEAIDDPEKRKAFMAEWQDEHSSLNNIGTRCHAYAHAIRAAKEAEK